MIVICRYCKHEYRVGSFTSCYHCGQVQQFPNVLAAEMACETAALDQRYADSIRLAQVAGTSQELSDFETEMRSSEAVIARHFGELERLSTKDSEIYSTYFQMVDAGSKVPATNEMDKFRELSEACVFPGYKERITFAALSLSRRGFRNYGDCYIVFRDEMIQHRATVMDENSLYLLRRLADNGFNPFKQEFPSGYRATWGDRHRLAVAKHASQILAGMQRPEFEGLIMQPRTVSDGEDQFIEVHIYGSWTRRSMSHVVIASSEPPDSPTLEAVVIRLRNVGVTVDII